MAKVKQYYLYTKDLFANETDTKTEQPWVYRGVVAEGPTWITTASLYVAVPKQEATK